MNEKEYNTRIALATIRLSCIQPAVNGTYPDMTKKAYYDRIAQSPLRLPDGTEKKYSAGTFACSVGSPTTKKGGLMLLFPTKELIKVIPDAWMQTR